MLDIMIDLETLGTRVNAPVVAVGACYFDIKTGQIGKTFDAAIDVTFALRNSRMEGETFKWWLQQSEEARQKVVRGRADPVKVYTAFHDFVQAGGDKVRVWGNGSSFDISMLEYSMARTIEKAPPWQFWNVRDCRTIKHLAEALGLAYNGQRKGVHHSALDDAVFQAEWVSYYWQRITAGPKVADLPAPSDEELDDLLG